MGFPDCSANKDREGSCPREERWSRERALGDARRRIMVEGLLLAHCIHSSLPDGETKAEREEATGPIEGNKQVSNSGFRQKMTLHPSSS